MARFTWHSRYSYRSRQHYYGRPRPVRDGPPLEAFVIDHLNTSRQTLILGLSNVRRSAEATIRSRSRVDTGRMKRLVTGTGDFGTDRLKITFGWESLAPYYAPFQEFGTRNGIQPMMAVYTAFHSAVPQVRRIIKG